MDGQARAKLRAHRPDVDLRNPRSALPFVLEYSAKASKGGKALAKTPCEGLDWLYLARYGSHLPRAQEIFDKINKNKEYVNENIFTALAGEFGQIFRTKFSKLI